MTKLIIQNSYSVIKGIDPELQDRIARKAAKKAKAPIKGLSDFPDKAPNPVIGWPEPTKPNNTGANVSHGGKMQF